MQFDLKGNPAVHFTNDETRGYTDPTPYATPKEHPITESARRLVDASARVLTLREKAAAIDIELRATCEELEKAGIVHAEARRALLEAIERVS